MKIKEPNRGDLVRWYCRNPHVKDLMLGLVLSVDIRQKMSNILWVDHIATCDWEDLEVV